LLFYALIIGALSGLASAFFRIALNFVEKYRESIFAAAVHSGIKEWIWPVIYSSLGITIALILVRKFAPEASGSGVHEIEGALDEIRPMRWKKVLPVKFLASLFSLGSGLLLGREGPTIQIGANIGKMVKDLLGQKDMENNPLVSAGAAAGLAGAFNAPFAGIVFVIEEMHEHFKFSFYSVAAIMVGAGTADIVVRSLYESKPVIEMLVFHFNNLSSLWLFALLGLLFSVFGWVFNRLLIFSMDIFSFLSQLPAWVTGVTVGLIVAILGIVAPEMIGGGYETIYKVLSFSYTIPFLLLLLFVRFILSVFSYSIGVPGGIFIPMLTLGIIFGMFFGIEMQSFFPELVSHPAIFAVAGMAAIFSSTVRAPLTGLVLAVEMTSNFELILPLIITTVVASVFTAFMGNKPIYSILLKRVLAKEKNPKQK